MVKNITFLENIQIEQGYPKFDEWVKGYIKESEVWSAIDPKYLYE